MIEIPVNMTRIDVRTQADVDALSSRTFDETTGVLVVTPGEPIDLSDALGLTWEKCGSCQRRYPDVYWADDTQWARVVGDTYAGLRCPECFCHEARNAGLDPVYKTLAPPLSKPAWLIVRGGDEPMHPDWVRSLRDQAVAAGVPFCFEGWGEWLPVSIDEEGGVYGWNGELWEEDSDDPLHDIHNWRGRPQPGMSEVKCWDCSIRVGRSQSGRLLDGETWDQRPDSVIRQQIDAMSPEEVDAELKANGIDMTDALKRVRKAVEEAKDGPDVRFV